MKNVSIDTYLNTANIETIADRKKITWSMNATSKEITLEPNTTNTDGTETIGIIELENGDFNNYNVPVTLTAVNY